MSTDIPRHSLIAPIAIMKQQGVPFRSIIDIGCADGTFALECLEMFGRDIAVLNIEAQRVYEPSLRKIQQRIGGHYQIAAVAAFDGQIAFDISEKSPYWSKTSPNGEFVACRTLDSLLRESSLPEPYLIKMDIEGSEFSALQGAVGTLEQVAAVILETDLYYGPTSRGNFLDLYSFLASRNFSLFDIVNFGYRPGNNVLFEVYTVFLNKRYEFRDRPGTTDGAVSEENLLAALARRRMALLARNEEILSRW